MKSIADIIHILEIWFKIQLSPIDFERYVRQLKHIPVEVLDDIVTDIINGSSPIPSKFPTVKTILEEYSIWKTNHPDHSAQRQRTPCTSCGGTGLLHFRQYIHGYPYSIQNRCGDCENCLIDYPATSTIPRRTMKEIKALPGFIGMD